MFVCNYDRKKIVDDHKQKYAEITKNCLWIKIADERLRFLQTKHLQCKGFMPQIRITLEVSYQTMVFLNDYFSFQCH